LGARDIVTATIHQEHQSLGRVLQMLETLLGKVALGHAEPDLELFAAALIYIDDFQERYHHPKEEDYLFRALLEHSRQFDAAIARLHGAHAGSADDLRQLNRLLVRCLGGVADAFMEFRLHVSAYALLMREHMRQEETLMAAVGDVLPVAQWERIAAAFAENDDPLFGRHRGAHFARLYQRIAMRAPRKLKGALHRSAAKPA
jgi:branched-chain amino acid transport system ATP-binding protein